RSSRDAEFWSGSISENTVWGSDTVFVTGSITIEPQVTLVIEPGVRIEFTGFFAIQVQGAVQAIGTAENRIFFTSSNSENFTLDEQTDGSWNGLRFIDTPSDYEPSILEYCIFQHSKAVSQDWLNYDFGGGAISVYNFSELVIVNCRFENNLAHFGGAIYLDHSAAPRIINCLFNHNTALENASVLYNSYAYPILLNNTIVDNPILNADDPFIESAAVLNFHSKPKIANNIAWFNEPESYHMHSQFWQNKDFYTLYNNLQDYESENGNINLEPQFITFLGGDTYHLESSSAGIDMGSAAFFTDLIPDTDLAGNIRIQLSTIDQGAFEFNGHILPGDANCDDVIDVLDIINVMNFVLELIEPDCYLLMDVNQDDAVNVLDVVSMINIILDEN
nr:hypothetical protein [FCB group bacterium]